MSPTTAVITVVSGRHNHLLQQHAGLARSGTMPDLYFVVSMGDDWVDRWRADAPHPRILSQAVTGAQLPVAEARNRGARAAIAAGAELLVFLDVDCIPTPQLVERYARAAEAHPGALFSGAVGYLPQEASPADAATFNSIAHFHAFRPRPEDGEVIFGHYDLFWSLSFAATADTWQRIGGFHEHYRGYGGEDTDFALLAEKAGVELGWVGGATAYHQHHPTSSPPVQHLDDILRNGALFARRWGFWPMQGWLDAFERRGLVARNTATGSYHRTGSTL